MNELNVIYEEDVETAFQKCVAFFGTPGKYVNSSENPQHVVVGTKKHGKLWYGDLSSHDMYNRLPELANILETEILVDRME